jgi:SAM-dependent methyltransferase
VPANCNTDVFADAIGKHSGFRKFYINITRSLLLKNNIIRKEIKLCSRRKQKVQHVLYAGFGMGQLLGLFVRQKSKFNVLAIDKNSRMVVQSSNYYKEEGINNIYCRTGDILEFHQPNTFDLCLAINLLNYIEDDKQAIRNMFESLKRSGILLIFNSSNYADDRDNRLNVNVYKDKRFRNGYGLLELKHKLKEIGFSKVKARYVYGSPGIISWKLTTGWPSYLVKTSKLFFLILPFYTIICIPFVILFNFLDVTMNHKKGKCVVVKAFKQS